MATEINIVDEKILLDTWHVATIVPGLPAVRQTRALSIYAARPLSAWPRNTPRSPVSESSERI